LWRWEIPSWPLLGYIVAICWNIFKKWMMACQSYLFIILFTARYHRMAVGLHFECHIPRSRKEFIDSVRLFLWDAIVEIN
jgi:hypothetical protein